MSINRANALLSSKLEIRKMIAPVGPSLFSSKIVQYAMDGRATLNGHQGTFVRVVQNAHDISIVLQHFPNFLMGQLKKRRFLGKSQHRGACTTALTVMAALH